LEIGDIEYHVHKFCPIDVLCFASNPQGIMKTLMAEPKQ